MVYETLLEMVSYMWQLVHVQWNCASFPVQTVIVPEGRNIRHCIVSSFSHQSTWVVKPIVMSFVGSFNYHHLLRFQRGLECLPMKFPPAPLLDSNVASSSAVFVPQSNDRSLLWWQTHCSLVVKDQLYTGFFLFWNNMKGCCELNNYGFCVFVFPSVVFCDWD